MRDGRTPPFNPFADSEPPRDEELAALLRQAVGDVPATVDWDALATRMEEYRDGDGYRFDVPSRFTIARRAG